MKKLLKLLNEYGKEHFEKCTNSENDLRIRKEICTEAYDEEVIISKRFGFIKWLVENDKIDKEFEDKKFLGDIFDSGYRFNNSFIEDRLLCYLALTDEPIEFLCSILK